MSGAPMALPPQRLGDIRQLIEDARQQAITLCSGNEKREQIELLQLDVSGIQVAEYLTALPSKEVLQAKLHEAIALSRARLDHCSGDEA